MYGVLDMSEIESVNKVIHDIDFDLCEFAEKLKTFMESELAEKNQRIKLDVAGVYRSHVVGDENALKKIFINLLSNASKYSEDGAEIHFSIREMPRLRTGYAHYFFSVQAQGIGKVSYIGMRPDIEKSLIEMLKGDIEVIRMPEQDDCLTVTLELKVREVSP